ALCAVPLSHLGLHGRDDGPGLVLRVWQPDTESVEVVDTRARRNLGPMTRLPESDLFVLTLPRRRKPFPYRLRITRHGQVHETLDPYAFRSDVFADHEPEPIRLHNNLGARLLQLADEAGQQATGTLFSVFAPSARSISVVGDFNGWDGRCHPMQSSHEGIWRLFIPELGAGTLYKFEIKGPAGNLLPPKADPFGFFCEQPPGNASIVYDRDAYTWQDKAWCERRDAEGYRNDRPAAIYEVHIGSWRRHDDGRHLSYRELADELIPYLTSLGYTHLELLPVMEHPFLGSWGYQVTSMFAPTSRYGPPDDFKYFVDRCHAAGLGVILDWVPAHFPSDEHGLAHFDGTALFEHPDPRRGWHPDWNTFIYDYGRPFVRDFLISSAQFWIEEFHVDGLRVDAVASMIYLDYSRNAGDWVPNIHGGNENLEAIDLIRQMNTVLHREHAGVMTIAEESTAWPKVSRPIYEGGLGFGYKWNMGWMHDTLSYMSKDPIYRKYHHGDMTFSLVYAFDEHFILPLSHDEVVHGKGSMLGKMPGDEWQQHANLRLYYGFMYGHPGKNLMFMGAEFGQVREWNHDAQLDWYLLDHPLHRGLHRMVSDLNHIYVNEPALSQADCSPAGFEWIDHTAADSGVLSFIRYTADREEYVVVVTNFTPVVRHGYPVGVPESGAYHELFNTDAELYGGSNVGNAGRVLATDAAANGRPHSLQLMLPPLATIYLKPAR
ncbi:MAG: 1,4-alpha-glucan branching protein GlgB, partial [Gammaproteobacteria bacterium]